VRAIAQRAARRAAQSFVPADGMPIPWQDFYTFIWWKLATKVRSAHPPTKLLRELAYKRARDFWRESENAPLGLGEFGQRIQERQDDQDRVQVRRVLFDAHTDTRPLPGRRTDQRQIWAADDVGSSDPLAARADLQQRLAAALGSLSLRVRQVAALGIYGYTMEEIATGVGVSLRTVQRDTVAADLALHRARPLPL
jgi:DNA-directed RNA polymerase specialized sigma24 family protein